MRNFLFLVFAVVCLSSCKAKIENPDNLPKDIALKPENNLSQQEDRELLSVLIKEIENQIKTVSCENAEDWTFAPIGEKPCGGPSSYIAYPKTMKAEILPKIEKFSEMQRSFNKKYQMVSDCRMVMPPTGIKCVDGKAVLVNENSAASEIQ